MSEESIVQFGKWNTDFVRAKEYAINNGIPLVAMWCTSNDEKTIVDKAADIARKLDNVVLWLGVEGKDGNVVGSKGFWWMTGSDMYRSVVKEKPTSRYPIIRIWWKIGDEVKVNQVMVGEDIIATEADVIVNAIASHCAEYFFPPKKEIPVEDPEKKENVVTKVVKQMLKPKRSTKKRASNSKSKKK